MEKFFVFLFIDRKHYSEQKMVQQYCDRTACIDIFSLYLNVSITASFLLTIRLLLPTSCSTSGRCAPPPILHYLFVVSKFYIFPFCNKTTSQFSSQFQDFILSTSNLLCKANLWQITFLIICTINNSIIFFSNFFLSLTNIGRGKYGSTNE